MSKVTGVQGHDAPYNLVRAAGKNELPELPESLLNDEEKQWMSVQGDRRKPVYGAVYWLISPKGAGRETLVTDHQGNVMPRLVIRDDIGAAAEFVKDHDFDKNDLNLLDFAKSMQARGFARVDHLKDEHGVPLGMPPVEIRNHRTRMRDWSWGVLNEARLKQLAAELEESESGRRLLANFEPQVSSHVRQTLQYAGGKTESQRKADMDTLATAEKYLGKAAAKIRAVADSLKAADEKLKASKPSAGKPEDSNKLKS